MSKNSIFGTGFILLSFCFSYCIASDTANNNIPNESVDEATLAEATTAKKSAKKPGKKFSAKELSGTMKEVEVNSVNFIKLKEKAGEVFIPNPDIIDVQLLSDNSLYLMGLAPGETTLVINLSRLQSSCNISDQNHKKCDQRNASRHKCRYPVRR